MLALLLVPASPAVASATVTELDWSPIHVHDPTPHAPGSGDERRFLNAAAWNAPILVSGRAAGASLIRVDLRQGCSAAGARSRAIDGIPDASGRFSIPIPKPDRTTLRDGMTVCATASASSDAGASFGPPVATSPATIDTAVMVGAIALDAIGPPADEDVGPGVAPVDFVSAAEMAATHPATLRVAPAADGDPDGDPRTHADVASIDVELIAGSRRGCARSVAELGHASEIGFDAGCLWALPDGTLVATTIWRDRAGNAVTMTSNDPVRLDRIAPARPTLHLPAVVTSNDDAAVAAVVAHAEPGGFATVHAWQGRRALGHPSASAPTGSGGSVTVPIDVRALADCPAATPCVEAVATVTDLAGNVSAESPLARAAKDTQPAAFVSFEPALASVRPMPAGRRIDVDDAASLAMWLRNDAADAEPIRWRLQVDDLAAPATPPRTSNGMLVPGEAELAFVAIDTLRDGELDVVLDVFDEAGNRERVRMSDLGDRTFRTTGLVRLTQPDPGVVQPRRFVVGGLAPTGATVELSLEDGPILDRVIATNGRFETTVDVAHPRPDGIVDATRVLVARTATGHSAMRLTIDDTPPDAPAVATATILGWHLAFDGMLRGTLAGLDADGIGSDAAARIEAAETDVSGVRRTVPVRIDGAGFVVELLPGPPGPRSVEIVAFDAAGNAGEPARLDVIALARQAPIVEPLPKPILGPDPRPTPPAGCMSGLAADACLAYATGREAPNPLACLTLDPRACAEGVLGRPAPLP